VGGTYKIRSDGAKKALMPNDLLAIFLKLEEDRFVSKFKKATTDMLNELSETKGKLSCELQKIQSIVEDMKDNIDENLGEIFENSSSANEKAEDAMLFSDQALVSIEEVDIKVEEIDNNIGSIYSMLHDLLSFHHIELPWIRERKELAKDRIKREITSLPEVSDLELVDLIKKCYNLNDKTILDLITYERKNSEIQTIVNS